MKFFIKKIFEGEKDDLVHLQFQKFSKGEFKNRAMVEVKNSGGRFSIKTTPEYGNEFVRFLGEKLGSDSSEIKGVIVSTLDLTGEIDFEDKKQFMGVKQYIISKEMSGEEILDIADKFKSSFLGLSFSVGNSDLKIKPKAPKSGKPSTKGEDKPKVDFCRLKTKDLDIVKEIIFDSEINDFKNIEISHDFIIEDIVIPDELKDEKDFSVIREKSLRKGRIVRRIEIDGKEIVKEKEFLV